MSLDGVDPLEAYLLTVPGRRARTGPYSRVLYWDEGVVRIGRVCYGYRWDWKRVRVQWDFWLVLSDSGRIIGKRHCGVDDSTVLKSKLGTCPSWLDRALWEKIPTVSP